MRINLEFAPFVRIVHAPGATFDGHPSVRGGVVFPPGFAEGRTNAILDIFRVVHIRCGLKAGRFSPWRYELRLVVCQMLVLAQSTRSFWRIRCLHMNSHTS